jgi:hypothetical protein
MHDGSIFDREDECVSVVVEEEAEKSLRKVTTYTQGTVDGWIADFVFERL